MKKTLKFFSIIIVVLLLSSTVAIAKVGYVSVKGNGSGTTPKEAVIEALTNALGKVNGMQLASQERAAFSSMTITAQAEGKQAAAELNKEEFQQQVQTATSGTVKEYRVTSIGPDPFNPNLVSVTLTATIAQYKKSKQADRNRIAVMPFRLSRQGDGVQQKYAKSFGMALVSYLTQTRRFAVLDRDFAQEIDQELSGLKASDVPAEEMARLGNKLGADYIVVGQINKAVAKRWNKEMKTTGKKFPMHQSGAELTYRVLDVATGQIMTSQVYDSITTKQGGLPDTSKVARFDAERVGKKIVEGIFPLVVVSVTGDSLYLGQGGETVKKGQQYTLIQYGKRVVDPYTKESLGREETPIGIIQVTDVQAKKSRARIVKCNLDLEKAFAPNTFIVREIKQKRTQKVATQKVKAVEKIAQKNIEDLEKDSSDDW